MLNDPGASGRQLKAFGFDSQPLLKQDIFTMLESKTFNLVEFSNRLRNLHKKFLENVRYEVENELGRTISPYEFLALLTQNSNFQWLKPFSSIVAEFDALTDEDAEHSPEDLMAAVKKLENVLQQDSVAQRYISYSTSDMDFIQLHIQLNKVFKISTPILSSDTASNPEEDQT